jgi:MOB kinase activator 1
LNFSVEAQMAMRGRSHGERGDSSSHSRHGHSHSSRFRPTETIEADNRLRDTVILPEHEDLNEWLAKNVTDIYHHLSLLYKTITEFCTAENCPLMTAGPGFKYLWAEGDGAKPVEVSAPEYIHLLLQWVDRQLEDDAIFPARIGAPFPDDFQIIVRNIMRRLFRIYAHCYYHHLETFRMLGTQAHLNTSFRHFVFFTNQFDLIEKDQLDPLRDMVDDILRSG